MTERYRSILLLALSVLASARTETSNSSLSFCPNGPPSQSCPQPPQMPMMRSEPSTGNNCPPCNGVPPDCGLAETKCALMCSPFPMDEVDNEIVVNCSSCQRRDFNPCIHLQCLTANQSETEEPSAACVELFGNTCGNRSTQQEDDLTDDCFMYCGRISPMRCRMPRPRMCMNISITYCRIAERSEECSMDCAMHEDCGLLVEGILQDDLTNDTFAAALSVTHMFSRPQPKRDCPLGIGKGLEILESLHASSLRGRPDRTILALDDSSASDLVQVYDDFLADERRVEWEGLPMGSGYGPSMLNNIEEAAKLFGMAANSTRGKNFSFPGNSIVMNIECATSEMYIHNFLRNSSGFRSDVTLEVPISSSGVSDCATVVSVALTRNLEEYTHQNSSQYSSNTTMINTHMVTLSMQGEDIDLKTNPARIIFTPFQLDNVTNHTCVFWDFQIGDWSSEDVSTEFNGTHYICTAFHLTSFAVLVQTTGTQSTEATAAAHALLIVSYIGCAISIVCLTVTIVFFLLLRKSLNKGVLLYIHFNLIVALLIALTIFVAGIEEATYIEWLCTLVAVLLHYFFLCVFCWMLAEGIMLYLLVVRVFGTAAEKWYYLLILGWGIPIPIVAVSVGIRHKDYGNDKFCWLSSDNGTIWAFIAPMIFIIVVNTVILIMTVMSIVRARMKARAQHHLNAQQIVLTALKGTVVLLPLLGLTWVFGMFAVNENTIVFAWLFTIFNSLQGLFIFIFHVLRNDKVLAFMRKMLPCKWTRKPKKKEFTETTTANSADTMGTPVRNTNALSPQHDTVSPTTASTVCEEIVFDFTESEEYKDIEG